MVSQSEKLIRKKEKKERKLKLRKERDEKRLQIEKELFEESTELTEDVEEDEDIVNVNGTEMVENVPAPKSYSSYCTIQ